MCRRQLALTSKDGDRKQARIQGLEEDAESLRREMKDHEGELHHSISEVLMYCMEENFWGRKLSKSVEDTILGEKTFADFSLMLQKDAMP